MSEFVCMDWDLQAIVRGYNSEEMSSTSVMENPPASNGFAPLSLLQQDGYFGFPDICDTTTILDELEELYKPFYPQTILTSSISVPSSSTEVIKKPKKVLRKKQSLCGSASSVSTDTDHETKPKKGKKNQHKRTVVQQVPADGLSSDLWAWRKYGQKPIKGSPYPRSYYRCSSSKGCLARKQVERSRSDPGVFIVTYSAEHNHALPTRRSSLAGSTRNKSSLQRGPATGEPPLHVPTEPTKTSTEGEFTLQGQDVKKKEEELLQLLFEDIGEENEIAMPDIVFSDELFPSLEDIEGLPWDQFHSNFDFRA